MGKSPTHPCPNQTPKKKLAAQAKTGVLYLCEHLSEKASLAGGLGRGALDGRS